MQKLGAMIVKGIDKLTGLFSKNENIDKAMANKSNLKSIADKQKDKILNPKVKTPPKAKKA